MIQEGSAPSPIRVVVVDDQPLIREGFRMILAAQADVEVVGEAGDGTTALEVIEVARPDVVLMDIRMPGTDGIEATRRIRDLGARSDSDAPRVLILTTFGHDDYVADALSAGAAGFLLKDATPEELVHAVRVVAAGQSLLSPEVTTRLIARVLPALAPPEPGARPALAPPEPETGRRARPAGWAPPGPETGPPAAPARVRTAQAARDQLTEREMDVLLLMARGRSNAEIASDLFISEATVKTHISHLLAKLELRDRVQAVVAAYELGLLAPGS